jgi:hypothetical protein
MESVIECALSGKSLPPAEIPECLDDLAGADGIPFDIALVHFFACDVFETLETILFVHFSVGLWWNANC